MKPKNRVCILALLASLSLLFHSVLQAQDNSLELRFVAKPASCVALHKGQLCFQKIQFTWQPVDQKIYCLYTDGEMTELYCSDSGVSQYTHDYASESFQMFTLRVANTDEVVASVKVSTSWVYRTGRRSSSGWRLF